ncbi:DUF4136 domain-containing protein [Algoriphagus sp. Y33]|uniref:DUF4136 domain-containing protein n=1 Tax=Algoriphagus sp. Y33 TaxID=2772483 RepID=UPI00177D1095|nr:DUF4136 domain-containing protein [Algoriphagus sp. Y33]
MLKLSSLLFLLFLVGCSSKIRVYDQFNPDYDFVANKEFTWFPDSLKLPEIAFYYNPSISTKMKEIIASHMVSRGYTIASSSNSLLFHHYIIISSPPPSLPYTVDEGREKITHKDPASKRSVTFILYLVDPGIGEVVWKACTMRELASATYMDEEETAARINELMNELVSAIFMHYPIDPIPPISN